MLLTAGESSDGAVGSSTTISASSLDMGPFTIGAKHRDSLSARRGAGSGANVYDTQNLFGDEARFGHQALVERIILLQELEHVLASEEDRFQRLLLHVVLVFRGLRHFLE